MNSETSEDDLCRRGAEEVSSPLGGSVVDLKQQDSTVLIDQTNQQSVIADDADHEPEKAKDTNRTIGARSRAVSAARSDLSFSTGVHPPPGTPESWQYGGIEYTDATDFTLEPTHIPSAENGNSASPSSSVRKKALLRAASHAENDEKQTESAAAESTADQKPITEDALPRVPSRFFTSEEWQTLHDKFEKPLQKSDEVKKAVESVKESDGMQKGAQVSMDDIEKIATHHVTTQSSQLLSPSTDYDPDFDLQLRRARKTSSLSEPQFWADSSISSLHSTESGHVPRSMRLGTVLPPKELADTTQSTVERQGTFHSKDESKDSVSTGSDTSGGVSLDTQKSLHISEDHLASIFTAYLQPPQTIATRESSPATTIIPSATNSPSKGSEDGGVPLKTPDSPKAKLTPGNLGLLPQPESPYRVKTLSAVSVVSGDPGKVDMSANPFDNLVDDKLTSDALETTTHHSDNEDKEKGKGKEVPPTWTLPSRPNIRPDPTGSVGSSKNAPATQSTSAVGDEELKKQGADLDKQGADLDKQGADLDKPISSS